MKSLSLSYLDHAAATPVDARVLEAMLPYFSSVYGNPSSFHSVGIEAKRAVQEARKRIASLLNAQEENIIFTSGGTESDSLAVLGIPRTKVHLDALRAKLGEETIPHVITSSVEHHAVLEPLLFLKKRGEIELTVLDVDRQGMVAPQDVVKALKENTLLVSIMMANNEIGTIEPIADTGRAILSWRKERETPYPFFHTDACQAAGYLDLDVEKTHVDLLTLNASKMYGPKGIGLLYIRKGIRLAPLIIGGGQERNLRSGTENVPGIIGLAKAFELAQASREEESSRLTVLRDALAEELLTIPKSVLNGHTTKRLPNNVNVSFLDIEGEAAILYLDAEGIMASTGSACASSSLDPSHVILATGLSYEAAHGSIRFTLGRSTTKEDVQHVLQVMPGVVERLRHMSPVNLDMKYFEKQ
ncbi:cysteine desulfurase NifS [Candidatus Uhrbacteria bacterium CG22_combo_CG10-13_8_21_14_all_47_17]|uniref:Cysteine desulfurase NifS n=1 Tax=Candidatus Uhrbacteria bacterium CG22_combo_CG10-13_8_21_14_all_47_17 TaxID=1975041 RepID=A0A2H0BSU2_9BACT|nr:MAG: cysteine desulfurase NifS [Candidatus Uhrbacteria bacterium CG22_combo_CG10-13_8_21_14_all_47_17]